MKLPRLIVLLAVLLPLSALAKPPVATPAAHDAESAALRRAKATVDKLTTQLTSMVKRAEAPGMDVAKVQALVVEFQAHEAGQRQESDAVAKLLNDEEKAQVGRYFAERATPLLARFEAVYKRVQNEADPQREQRQRALLADLEALGHESEAVVQLARNAGKDVQLRAAAIDQLDKLLVSQHALYHTGAGEVQVATGREQWDNLFAMRVERPLQRAERLLRMGLQTPSATYVKAQAEMASLSKQSDELHAQWPTVQDWPSLKALQDREATLQASVQKFAQGWKLLAADEAAELDAVARETLVPAVERMSEDSREARKRLPPEPAK